MTKTTQPFRHLISSPLLLSVLTPIPLQMSEHNYDRLSLHLRIRTMATRSRSTITFAICSRCLVIYALTTPDTPSGSELPLQPPVKASQNTSCGPWTAGPPKRFTTTSVQISKISDPHNLILNDWRLLRSVGTRARRQRQLLIFL